MKSLLLVIVLIVTVDCRSHFKPQPEPLETPSPEWFTFDDEPQLPHGAIMMDDDYDDYDDGGHKENQDTEGFENTNPDRVADGELYQGDMLLSDDQWAALKTRKAKKWESFRWTEGPDGYPQVPYLIEDKDVSKYWVNVGLDHWMEHTCIKFKETTNTDQPHLRFINGEGCYSAVGMYPNNGQKISPCTGHRTVVHEIGHAIGFHHEQSRSDRDDYITIYRENVKEKNLHNYEKEIDDNYGVPYDYSSVMHYDDYAFHKNRKRTIITKDPLNQDLLGLLLGKKLSHRDKLLANKMYKCIDKWVVECGLSSDPCLNDGYTGKACSCICPPGTSGTYCEEKVGDYYGSPWCGGLLDSSSGTIRHSKNRMNERCIWKINTDQPIKITFSSINIFKQLEHLYIRDGINVTSPPTGDFTGAIIPNPIQLTTNKAYIVFQSDSRSTDSSFELQWESSGCNGVCTQNRGTIRHPSSGNTYENNENIDWVIKAESAICIKFVTFDVEAGFDNLYITDGEGKEIGVFTGSNIPGPVQTTTNVANLVFRSDSSITRAGFEIQWDTSAC